MLSLQQSGATSEPGNQGGAAMAAGAEDHDALLERANERANTAHNMFMLLDADADGRKKAVLGGKQLCATCEAERLAEGGHVPGVPTATINDMIHSIEYDRLRPRLTC